MRKYLMLGLVGILYLVSQAAESTAQTRAPVKGFGELLYHRASIAGNVQWTDDGLIGSEIELDGMLGLEKTNGFSGKAGLVLANIHEFILDFRRYSTSEDAELETSLRFGGIALPLFLPVSPSLKFQSIGVFYGFRLVDLPSGFFAIRPGVEFVEYEVSVEFDVPLVEIDSQTYGGDVVVPFVWVAGELRLHPMASITGELSGGWQDEQTAYWGQALLKFLPHPNVAVLLGYSQVWFQDTQQKNNFEVTLSGPVLGVQVVW